MNRKIISLLACLLFFVSFSGKASALGLAPPTLYFENLLPHSETEKSVFFSRGNYSSTEYLRVTITGTAAEYIEPYFGEEGEVLEFSAGEQVLFYPITVKPGSLAEGTYEAKLHVQTVSLEEAREQLDIEESKETGGSEGITGSLAIMTGVIGTIEFSVTNDEIEDYSIRNVLMPQTEENHVLGFSYFMINDGNVDTRPARIKMIITSEKDSSFSYEETFEANQLELVPALSEETVTVLTNADLKEGQYNVDMSFFDKDEEEIYADAFPLEVYAEGTLEQEGVISDFSTEKSVYELDELVLFEIDFENTGTVGLSAAAVVEVFLEGSRVEILKTDSVFIPTLKNNVFETSFRVSEEGSYEAVAYVEYGIYESDQVSAKFRVGEVKLLVYLIIIGGIFVLLLFLLLLWSRRRKKQQSVTPIAPKASQGSQLFPDLKSDSSATTESTEKEDDNPDSDLSQN